MRWGSLQELGEGSGSEHGSHNGLQILPGSPGPPVGARKNQLPGAAVGRGAAGGAGRE